ncbi:hypothetical protein [Streptomyces parvus]|uniref:hypothetical protein n=1 Tax=Streptomyces parvus TaxID=66428 RepID=UPI0033CD00B1
MLRLAVRVKAQFADSTKALALAFLFYLVVVFGTGVVWAVRGGELALVGAVVTALVLLCIGMLPLIRGRQSDTGENPLWPPLMLLVVPTAVLVVALPSLIVSLFLGARAVELTHDFTLSSSELSKEGEPVTAEAETGRTKARLYITFDATESDPNRPACAPASTFTLTPLWEASAKDVRPGEEADFRLGRNQKKIELKVQMTAGDDNCLLALKVAAARMDD